MSTGILCCVSYKLGRQLLGGATPWQLVFGNYNLKFCFCSARSRKKKKVTKALFLHTFSMTCFYLELESTKAISRFTIMNSSNVSYTTFLATNISIYL